MIYYRQVTLLGLLCSTAPALAQDAASQGAEIPATAAPAEEEAAEPTDPLDVEASIALVSDFRRGGISSSDGKVAVQGELVLTHQSGLYGAAWASNFASDGGDDAEVDFTIGYATDIGGFQADVSAIHYIFLGVPGSRYWEFGATVSHPVGPITLGVGAAYTPEQSNTGDADNLYLGIEAEWAPEGKPFAVTAAFGHEHGAFGDHKLDWSIGVTYALCGFDLGVAYVDAANTHGEPHSDGVALFSISRTF